jgi:hypothetical protein
LVQPVERTKDLRRASEIPSSANQDLHGFPCTTAWCDQISTPA